MAALMQKLAFMEAREVEMNAAFQQQQSRTAAAEASLLEACAQVEACRLTLQELQGNGSSPQQELIRALGSQTLDTRTVLRNKRNRVGNGLLGTTAR